MLIRVTWIRVLKMLFLSFCNNYIYISTRILGIRSLTLTLREKYPNTEFFLVRIFPHSDWIRRDTPYLSVFSPNVGKYGPEKTPYLDTFYAVGKRSLISLNWNKWMKNLFICRWKKTIKNKLTVSKVHLAEPS